MHGSPLPDCAGHWAEPATGAVSDADRGATGADRGVVVCDLTMLRCATSLDEGFELGAVEGPGAAT